MHYFRVVSDTLIINLFNQRLNLEFDNQEAP